MRRLHHQKQQAEPLESPLTEGLINIGFDEVSARAIVKRYPSTLVTQWTDITLAALEKYGKRHFRKSPMAFMLDSLQKAAKGERTPPDWWLAIRKQEQRPQEPSLDGKRVLSKLMDEVFGTNRTPADEKTSISPMRSILKSII